MTRWMTKALAVTPGVLISTAVTCMVGAVLPAPAALLVFAGGLLAAATLAVGTVAGLYRVRSPKSGTVLAYAGEDAPFELAGGVLVSAGNAVLFTALYFMVLLCCGLWFHRLPTLVEFQTWVIICLVTILYVKNV